ncbi:alkaline ceramidase ydc1 [Rhizina undulata]
MQLVDELSMIYTTSTFSYGRSNGFAFFLGGLLVSIAGSITAIYHYLQDPKFHQNAYAILTAIVCFRSWWMMETRIRAKDPAAVRIMWMMVVWGLGIFLGGFALWNVDNKWCGELKSWRRAVGMPWGFLAEGHGWWHLLTGIGAYYYIVHGRSTGVFSFSFFPFSHHPTPGYRKWVEFGNNDLVRDLLAALPQWKAKRVRAHLALGVDQPAIGSQEGITAPKGKCQ